MKRMVTGPDQMDAMPMGSLIAAREYINDPEAIVYQKCKDGWIFIGFKSDLHNAHSARYLFKFFRFIEEI